MTDSLPFTRKPGVLYMASLGAEPPERTVENGLFVGSWPSSWVEIQTDPANLTEPAECTESLIAGGPATWDFGPTVRALLMWWHGQWPGRPQPGLYAAPRFLLGWESEDRKDRLAGDQVVVDEQGRCILERTSGGQVFTWYRARTAAEHNAEVRV